jgi:hypothetical protein
LALAGIRIGVKRTGANSSIIKGKYKEKELVISGNLYTVYPSG